MFKTSFIEICLNHFLDDSLSEVGSTVTEGGGSSTPSTLKSNQSVATNGNAVPPPPVPASTTSTLTSLTKRPSLQLKPATPPKLNLKNCLNESSLERRISKLEDKPAVQVPSTDIDTSSGELILITIFPDEQGKFGFNVKGGIDQKSPIIVSRVGANTPAEK